MEVESPIRTQIEDLLAQEKTSRLNSEAHKSVEILVEITSILYNNRQFDELFVQLKSLCKKRGQSKKAITSMVQQCMGYIETLSNLDYKLQLIETLKEVCDKKIYLEVEYARCCLMMVKWNENQANIEKAANIMQEVQVETYGSMDKREKLEFILYQMKIMIKLNDIVRLYIVSKKVQPKSLEDPTIYDLKIQFHAYMILYFKNQKNYFEIASNFKAIFDTMHANPTIYLNNIEFGCRNDIHNIFQNYVFYLCISDHSALKQTHLYDLNTKYIDSLDQHQNLKQLVTNLLSTNLISTNTVVYCLSQLEAVQNQGESEVLMHQLFIQLIQHNLLVFYSFYSQITLGRMAEIMGVQVQEVEEVLCELINQTIVHARIDRVKGIVRFGLKRHENQVLEQWGRGVQTLLNVVDQTTNLIKRDTEIHAA